MEDILGVPMQKIHLAEQVANRIREFILSEALQLGDRLPSERALGERLGVSRIVVREALKQLKAQGLVDVRRGSGTYVCHVSHAHVTDSITLYFQTRKAPLLYDQLNEVRRPLELEIAGRAAQRATADDIEELEQAYQNMVASLADSALFARYDLAFHVALAAATHNELFRLLLGSIAELHLDLARSTYEHDRETAVQNAIVYHRLILECVKARDTQGARDAMQVHLHHAQQLSEALNARRQRDSATEPEAAVMNP
jgi:GntR family transcriptional regulator, transcriptional repressor for pyruvate dehydrogenase complex